MRGRITRVVRGEGLEGGGGFELKKMEIREGRRRAKQGGRCAESGERGINERQNRRTEQRTDEERETATKTHENATFVRRRRWSPSGIRRREHSGHAEGLTRVVAGGEGGNVDGLCGSLRDLLCFEE